MTSSGRSLWTWTLTARAVAGDEDRLADRLEVGPDRVDVESAAGRGRTQVHRLVAEALVGMGDERRRLGAARGPRADTPPGDRLAHDVLERALEQPVQPLPTGVDDAGLAQDRQQDWASWRPAFSAASTVAARTVSMSSSRSAAVTAATAASRMTVRIVPSTGFATAA